MKRRALIEQGMRVGRGLAAGGAAVILSGPRARPLPVQRRTGLRSGGCNYFTWDEGRSPREWWEEFHNRGRFEERVCAALNRCRVEQWWNSVQDRVALDGLVYGALVGLRANGDARVHPEIVFHTRAGDRPDSHWIGLIEVSVSGPHGEPVLSNAPYVARKMEWPEGYCWKWEVTG